MSDKGSGLGILGYDSFEFVVTDIERSRRFYGRMMDVAQVARLSGRESERRGESALLYSAGNHRVRLHRDPAGGMQLAMPWRIRLDLSIAE